MKDLLATVSSITSGLPSKSWWVSIVVSPFEGDPTPYTTRETEHQLHLSIDPFRTQVSLCLKGETTYDTPTESQLDAMLKRFEKKTGVSYRLDRALISGSPAKLKSAVRQWLATLRPGAPPADSFEGVAAQQGIDPKTVGKWMRALEGGAGHETALDETIAEKLLAADHFLETARACLGALELPKIESKKAYKRTVRMMVLLLRDDDAASADVLEEAIRRAQKTPMPYVYTSPLALALHEGSRLPKARVERLKRLLEKD